MFEIFTFSIFDFLGQLLGFLGFIRIFNSTTFFSNLEISGFFLPLFFIEEDSFVEVSFFFNVQSTQETFLNSEKLIFHFTELSNKEVLNFENFNTLNEVFAYFNFLTFDYDLEYEIFDFISFFIIFVLLVFINRATLLVTPQDDIVQFLSLVGTALTSGDDFFSLFLGFELLTIILVLFMALDQRRFSYNKTIIFYYLLSVVVSLVIFFFLFLFYFLLNPFTTTFINFYTFVFTNFEVIADTSFFSPQISFGIKFFFLNLCLLLMFKFTLGPAAFWITYLYPSFPVFVLFIQMVFLKYNLFFLFFDFFDFLFFYSAGESLFVIQTLSVILLVSLFFGSFAYKINNLKLLLTITSFSQVSYVCVSYLSPSFILISYSLNYLLIYLVSIFFVLLILLVCNVFFNIQHLHELAYLRYYDFAIFLSIVFLFCSLAGLPPFIGFFAKYFLLVKLLNTPYLFFYGFSLLLISFLTLYIYLSVVYGLFKTTLAQNFFLFNRSNFIFPIKKIFNFITSTGFYLLCFFLLSPFISFFTSVTFFFFFFEKFHLVIVLDLLEYYFY